MSQSNYASQTQVVSPRLKLESNGVVKVFNLGGESLTLGRQQSCQLVVDTDWKLISGFQASLRWEGRNYRLFEGNGTRPSTNGIFLNNVRIPLKEGILLHNGIQLTIGVNPQNQVLVTYENPLEATPQKVIKNSVEVLSLENKTTVVIGRDRLCDFPLESPLVSRRHAIIEASPLGYQLRDFGSTNGIFIAGHRVTQQPLQPGMVFQIGPYSLLFQGKLIRLANTDGNFRLDACDLIKDVLIRGKKRRILDQVSLPIEPGQLVAIVGGSGAGKSTLMKALLGINSTTKGTVFINSKSLRENYNLYRTQLGYVPQDDIIHRELRVEEALTYAAHLRLSFDLNGGEIRTIVDKTLTEIEMAPYRDSFIQDLSGGQRKRISIGVELLANPKLFFLDEPTSGLDPGLDKKMMQLLRKLADSGRTVVLVTHATANIKLCDRIAFMGRGGKLCYYGPPGEILSFFGLTPERDFADVYNGLEEGEKVVERWYKYFVKSPQYEKYITYQLNPEGISQATDQDEKNHKNQGKGAQKTRLQPGPFSVQQFWFLAKRTFQLVLRDRLNLALALIPAPVAIILMATTVESNILVDTEIGASLALRILFVVTCAAMWTGFSSSLQTLVKEIQIYLRERLVNLRLLPYLGSKLAILAGLALAQTLLMVVVILLSFESPNPTFDLRWDLGVFITTFLTCFTSMTLGLGVSAFVNNATQANSALPLLLLPQIVFSGVLIDLQGSGSFVAKLMLSHWSVRAYASLVDVNNLGWPPGLETDVLDNYNLLYAPNYGDLLKAWGMLVAHTTIYFLITFILQKRKDPIA
jgi:ABC-type multidrug transport system ATPase subunit/pSer/pThr/pTyr-binding forkhead associated (FHA) protein